MQKSTVKRLHEPTTYLQQLIMADLVLDWLNFQIVLESYQTNKPTTF